MLLKFLRTVEIITITLENIHHTIQVSIADQGNGVFLKDIPHLLKFKRIDNSARRKIGGTMG